MNKVVSSKAYTMDCAKNEKQRGMGGFTVNQNMMFLDGEYRQVFSACLV